MTTKQDEIKIRKDRILSVTINHYIRTVAPVSSETIVKESRLDVSSATVRNILAELEKEGYLTHPHTSAGRIPTQYGYRYYVDHLMNEIQLLEDEKNRIKEEYVKESSELENLLEKTSEVLTDATHYTSIISVDGWGNRLFLRGTSLILQHPDYQKDIDKIHTILKTLEEKERMLEVLNRALRHKVDIYIGQEIACKPINSCSLVITGYKTRQGVSGRMAVLGPTRMNYERVVSTFEYLTELMEEMF